ncbi:ferredoxin [Candidatus Marinamargulisbacteria bacterium SCGC AG-343-D04]|nr:ferredoxin [Candidatus Marinamargulisbacteria bacterium SCGC AG-343-D04]
MAQSFIYEENCDGAFYVHDTCIACDTCTDISPSCFQLTSDYDHAFVSHQPQNSEQVELCLQAQEACPVAAIGKRS